MAQETYPYAHTSTDTLHPSHAETACCAHCLALAAQVAQFAAELERYSEAIEIYEGVARASVDNNLLKYSAKGYLLNAGICQLCSARPGAHTDKSMAPDMLMASGSCKSAPSTSPTLLGFRGVQQCRGSDAWH